MLVLQLTPASFNELYSKLLKEKSECLCSDGTLDLSQVRIEKEPAPARGSLGLVGLTRQQYRVLVFISEGKTNKQIARLMGLSEKTVKAHVTGVLQILHLDSRTQAALYYTSLVGSSPVSSSTPETGSVSGRSPIFLTLESTTSQTP